jgi:hypothetical protein
MDSQKYGFGVPQVGTTPDAPKQLPGVQSETTKVVPPGR